MPSGFSALESYLDDMANPRTFGDGIIIMAAALKYARPIHIFHTPESRPSIFTGETVEASQQEPIYIAHTSVNFGYSQGSWRNEKNDHYISLLPSPIRYSDCTLVIV